MIGTAFKYTVVCKPSQYLYLKLGTFAFSMFDPCHCWRQCNVVTEH